MDRQKLKRIFAVIFILSCVFCIFSTTSLASSDPFNFEQYDNVSGNTDADKIAQNTMGTAIKIVRTVATGVAIIMLSYIGIKYMMAAPSEKADFKKSATIYVLGAILIFAAGNILALIANFTTNNITN